MHKSILIMIQFFERTIRESDIKNDQQKKKFYILIELLYSIAKLKTTLFILLKTLDSHKCLQLKKTLLLCTFSLR